MNGVEKNCTIFLGYTSNMASCGVRDTIRFLVQHKADLSFNTFHFMFSFKKKCLKVLRQIRQMVDCIVASAGGVEEDFIKCLAPTYLGDFSLPGRELRDKGINRIGNLLVPNNNYVKFEVIISLSLWQ